MDIFTSVMVALFYLYVGSVYCLGLTLGWALQLFSLCVSICYASIVLFCNRLDNMVCLYVNNHSNEKPQKSLKTSQMSLCQLTDAYYSQDSIEKVNGLLNGD